MSIDETRKAEWVHSQQQRSRAMDSADTLKGGGGGGMSGDMESRVAKLENGVHDINKQLTDVRVLLAGIDERTKHMPSKWDVVLILGGMAGLISAIVVVTARFAT